MQKKELQNQKKLFPLPIDKFSGLKWIKYLSKLKLTYPSAVGKLGTINFSIVIPTHQVQSKGVLNPMINMLDFEIEPFVIAKLLQWG